MRDHPNCRCALLRPNRGPSFDLVRRIDDAVQRGQHVTTANVGGMTVCTVHEPTDEARQQAIKDFNNAE